MKRYPYVQGNTPFIFQPTLDGQVCLCKTVWNLFDQCNYLQVYNSSGTLICSRRIVESPPAIQLQSLVWDPDALQVQATAIDPHGIPLLTTTYLSILGNNPAAYNGTYACFVDSPTTFLYPLSNDPGSIQTAGAANFLLSIIAGYFYTPVVFRNNTFEVYN